MISCIYLSKIGKSYIITDSQTYFTVWCFYHRKRVAGTKCIRFLECNLKNKALRMKYFTLLPRSRVFWWNYFPILFLNIIIYEPCLVYWYQRDAFYEIFLSFPHLETMQLSCWRVFLFHRLFLALERIHQSNKPRSWTKSWKIMILIRILNIIIFLGPLKKLVPTIVIIYLIFLSCRF